MTPADPHAESTPDVAPMTGNKATGRVLTILSAFLDGPQSLGISEISRKLGMTKSMVSRGLTTLVNHNYVVRDETGTRYQLGFALADFGTLSMPAPDLHLLCRPTMARLNELTGATISLHIPVGNQAVCIDGLLGHGPVARGVPLGFALPLHVSAAARSILAFMSDDDVDRYLDNPPDDPARAIAVAEDIWHDVRTIRREGFARGLGNYAPKSVVTGIGFPVLDMHGTPHASLTVAGPAAHLTAERIEALLPAMKDEMDALSRESRLYVAERVPVS